MDKLRDESHQVDGLSRPEYFLGEIFDHLGVCALVSILGDPCVVAPVWLVDMQQDRLLEEFDVASCQD